mgnify:CR=1 FL=1
MNTSDLTALSTELALLGFVHQRPTYGYEIYQRVTASPELRLVWRFKQSRLYAMLARLEDGGYLHATQETQDGRPPRKVFHLTQTGKLAFEEWLSQPVAQPREMRLAFMLKLYFAGEVSPKAVALLIRRQQEVCVQWLALQEREDDLDAPFVRAVRGYRRSHIEAIRDWLTTLVDDPVAAGTASPIPQPH